MSNLTKRDIFNYLLAYILWFIMMGVGWLAVSQTRMMLNVLWPVLGGNRWVLRAVDRWGMVILVMAWLGAVVTLENYYRGAISQTRLRRERAAVGGSPLPRTTSTNPVIQCLARWELDLLARRFAITIAIPIGLFLVTYTIKQLAFVVIGG